MKKTSRFISILISLVMVFSIFTSLPVKAKAETKVPQIDKKALIQKHLKNFKDVDYKKALSQKYGIDVQDEKTSSENKVINPDDEVRIIVELQGTTVYEQSKSKKLTLAQKKAIEQNIEKDQKVVIDKVKKYGKIRHSYKNLLNGFSATVKFKDIDAIRELPNVKKVTVANKYYLDMNSARGITNAETVWQDLGVKGEGMVVAIVDTGIDYTHKDMRLTDSSNAKLNKTTVEGMGGPGHFYTDKVPYGYNFADMNDQVMDLGPGASMHGMHVAGIVAANGTDEEVKNNAAIKGVAPEAQLLAMKVFTNNPDMPSAYSDDIAAAIDDSVKHGADVINMSLGSTAGFVNYDDPEQLAIKNATDMGVTVVVSAGNSYFSTYPYAAYAMDPDISLVGSPGLFPDTLQVASSENNQITLNTLKVYIDGAQDSVNIAYQKQESPDPVKVFGDRKIEAVYVGTGEPQYYEGKNVAGKLVFAVRTGNYYYRDIQHTAEQHGAAGVIIRGYEYHGDYVNMALDNPQIPVVSLSINDGNNLMNAALAGKKLEFTFTNDKMLVNNSAANQMSDFSSWGTTPDLEFKPEVSAPGGKIYSTVNNNEYTMMSGTSMAAPHISGATALVAQYVKKTMPNLSGRDFVNMVKTLLTNSAEPMLDPSTGNKLPYLTRKQGAGVIKTDKAIKTGAYVTTEDGKAVIALKEISGKKEFKLKIKNFSDKDLKFKLVNKYGVLTNYTENGFMYPVAAVLSGATLTFDKETIMVKKGETEEITATLTVPSTANNIFAEGYIELQPQTDGQPSLGIPYMGFCGKWSGQDAPRMIDAPVWDLNNTFYGATFLMDSNGYYLGYDGFDDYYGIPIINPNQLDFSPNNDGVFDEVIPVASFMRNAKEFKIQVVDDKGNVIREVSLDKNIRKNYMMQDFPATYNFNWVWDGTIFNSNKLTYELAPEGNYKIRLLAKPDFENADWYTLDMPVRLDLTPPDFDFDIEKVQGDEFKVKIKNPSNDIQFYGYNVFDEWGNFLWDEVLNVNSNGEATVHLINRNCYFIIYAVDYAANATDKGKYIINTSFEVYCPEDCIFNEGYPPVETNNSATINFMINEALRPALSHIGIKVVNAGNARDEVTLTPSETCYKIENLVDGECTATINLYGKDNKVLATETEYFLVDLTPPQITLLNTTGSSIVLTNGEKVYNLKFKVSDMSTGFKVLLNGETIAQEYYNLGSLYENTFDIPVQIKEGENKFTIKAVDFVGHEAVSEVTINSTLDKPVIVVRHPNYIGNKKVEVSGYVIYKSEVEIEEFKINGEAVQLSNNNFTKELTYDSFGDKTISYYIKAKDGAENAFIQNFKLSPIEFENRYYKTKENSQTINFNIVQDDTLNEAKLYISVNGAEVKEYSTTSSSITVENLNDGNNVVEFIIKDKEEKEIVRDYVEVFVDNGLPYITAVDKNGNNISEGQIYNNGNVEITGQVSEPVKYLKYKVYGKDEESDWANITVNEGFFKTTLNLFEGMNRVTFEMEDESGNINSYQAKIWVDTTAPILTIEPNETNVVTDKHEYTIKINIKENTYSYRLYINENQIDYGESESVEGVEKTIEYKYSVPNGKSNVVIKAVDLVGNTSWYLIEFNKGYTPLDSNFNKNADYEKATGGNIDFNITFNGDKLNSIMYNNKLLKEGKDYAVGDNKITLKEDFLMTLPVGENVLTLNFNSGDYNVVVNVTDSRSTNATLAGIKVGDKALAGFRVDKYEYEYEVNPMLEKPLTVSAVVSDPKAKVEITQAAGVEGTAVIKVTAQDGTVKTYIIKFIIPLKLEKLTDVTEFTKNIDAVIKVKATNISKALKNAQLIIGLFDKDNKLVNYVAGGYQIKSGEEVVMEGQIKTPNADGYKIKCFIWDILNSQNPLSKVFEFLIK